MACIKEVVSIGLWQTNKYEMLRDKVYLLILFIDDCPDAIGAATGLYPYRTFSFAA